MSRTAIILLAVWLFSTASVAEEPLTIAVASNFASTAEELVAEFSALTDTPVRLSAGSTGKLYAQISHGAPFDVFLSADEQRPALLEEQGLALPGSRFTYAIGSLVLWSADKSNQDRDCRDVLRQGDYRRLAIANPDTAPYGRAAKEYLQAAGLWNAVAGHMAFGENISQTLQFVATGNAALGFVAAAQMREELQDRPGCFWAVPTSAHAPIAQQAVALSASRNPTAAQRFVDFLRGPVAMSIIRRRGYEVSVR